MHAGSVENFVMIVDLKDVGLTSLPMGKVKGIITSGQRNFRGRLFRQFTLNSGWVIRQAWKIVSSVVDEFTAQKMNVVKEKETLKVLTEHIDPECIEEKFGGKLPNILQGKFFPPDMNLPSGEPLLPSTFGVKEEVEEVKAETVEEVKAEAVEEVKAEAAEPVEIKEQEAPVEKNEIQTAPVDEVEEKTEVVEKEVEVVAESAPVESPVEQVE